MSELDRAGFFGKYLHWKPEVVAVALPDGERCFVRVMGGTDLDAHEMAGYERIDGRLLFTGRNARAELVVRCACKADGTRLFQDEEAANVGMFPGPILDAIYQAAKKLNRIGEDTEQAAKNLPAARNGSSGSGSPEALAAPSPSASSG